MTTGGGVTFIGAIFTPWAVVYAALPLFVTLTGWFWPKKPAGEHVEEMMAPGAPDPVCREILAVLVDRIGAERFPGPIQLDDAAWVGYRLAEPAMEMPDAG